MNSHLFLISLLQQNWKIVSPWDYFQSSVFIISQNNVIVVFCKTVKHIFSEDVEKLCICCLYFRAKLNSSSFFFYCFTVHFDSINLKWREVPTWCNNLFIIINNSTCFGLLYAHLQEHRLYTLYTIAYGVYNLYSWRWAIDAQNM